MIDQASLHWRQFHQRAGFSLVIALTVALSVGLAAAAASLTRTLFLQPLPYPEEKALHVLNSNFSAQGWWEAPGSIAEFAAYREAAGLAATVAIFHDLQTLGFRRDTPGSLTERFAVNYVEHGHLDLLGAKPQRGRLFTATETTPGSSHEVAIVSDEFWRNQLGAREDVIGMAVDLGSRRYTVVGVMQPDFRDVARSRGRVYLWLPLPLVVDSHGQGAYTDYALRRSRALVRLRPGATLVAARQEADGIARRLAAAQPVGSAGRGFYLQPLREYFIWRVAPPTRALFIGATLLLAIAGGTLSNLAALEALRRRHEYAVRAALGATRSKLAVLAAGGLLLPLLAGGAGAWAFGEALMGALRRSEILLVPRFFSFELSPAVFVSVIALLTGLVVATAVVASRLPAGGPLAPALRTGSKGLAGVASARSRLFLVALGIALATCLLIGLGLTLRSLHELMNRPTGFREERLLSLSAQLDRRRHAAVDDRVRLYRELAAQLDSSPRFGATIWGPGALGYGGWVTRLTSTESAAQDNGATVVAQRLNVLPGGLELIGIPLLRGRDFSPEPATGSPLELIVDAKLAARLWPGQDPLGRSAYVNQDPARRAVVVGLAAPSRHRGRAYDESQVTGDTYFNGYQTPTEDFTVLVRHPAGEEAAALTFARACLSRVDPYLAAYDVIPVAARLAREEHVPRFTTAAFGVYALVALALTIAGVYGVLSHAAAQRTREFGVRLATGATPGRLLRQVLGEGVRLAGFGVAIGVVGALLAGPLLRTMLVGVSPRDPLVFTGSAILVLVLAAVASALPAVRAARTDPLVALRSD